MSLDKPVKRGGVGVEKDRGSEIRIRTNRIVANIMSTGKEAG